MCVCVWGGGGGGGGYYKLYFLFYPTGSHRATSEEKDSQLENIKNIGNGDQNTGNGCCTSVVQGSSNMDANSLLVDMLKSLRPLENPVPSSSSLPLFEQDFVIDHQRGRQQLVLQPPDADNTINKDVHQPQNPNFQRTRSNLLTQNSCKLYDQSLSSEQGTCVSMI